MPLIMIYLGRIRVLNKQKKKNCAVLVVSMPLTNERPPLQGVPGMEDAAEDSVDGDTEGDQEVEEQVEGLGSAGQWEIRAGSTGLPLLYRCGKAGAAAGSKR